MQIRVVGYDDKSRIRGRKRSVDRMGDVMVNLKGVGSVKQDYPTLVAGF